MSDPFIGLAIVLLIVLSAIFSGLNLGLFSITQTDLERKSALGDKRAKRVLRLRNRGNLLLVTILLANVAINASISIILGDVMTGLLAGVMATGLIVIFGDIVPQAVCTRYALEIGSRTAWIMEVSMLMLYPVAKPLAWALDKTLGEELRVIWTKRELEHIISMHEDDPRSGIDADEERIIIGALRFSDKTAEQVMTPRDRVFMLSSGDTLGEKLLERVQIEGFTRIPVYDDEKEGVVGLVMVKDLLGMESARPITDIMRTDRLVRVTPGRKLDEVLNLMIARHSHMALVTEKSGTFIGIVTLEDVLEEIIGREIHDEDDVSFEL